MGLFLDVGFNIRERTNLWRDNGTPEDLDLPAVRRDEDKGGLPQDQMVGGAWWRRSAALS